jgi:N-acetylmuramoyl-L-alanine amidase
MPTHVVESGECMTAIAARFGIHDPAAVYGHPENAALRDKRPNMNVLLPGDEVFVPEPQPKKMERGSDATHKFVARVAVKELRVVLLDADRQPIAGAAYVLTIGFDERTGTTTSEGVVHEKRIPARATSALLTLPDLQLSTQLEIGALDPIGADTGVNARLQNLGYPESDDGLAAFASERGLAPGDRDAHLDALLKAHGA